MTQNLAVTQSTFYGLHQRSRKAFIANRFAERRRTAVALGGWEMMRAIGLPVKNCLLKEAELGAFIAMTMPVDVGYHEMIVANTTLGDKLDRRVAAELKILNEFNQYYYYQARTFGSRIAFSNISAVSADEKRNCLNQDTGITRKYLEGLLGEGIDLFPDRNDPRLGDLLGSPSLFDITDRLNDKNEFYRFLGRRSITFPRPLGVLIDAIPLDILEELRGLSDKDAMSRFVSVMKMGTIKYEGAFDPLVNYFIKVSGGAGGNVAEVSMCRMHPMEDNPKLFKGIIENLIRRTLTGVKSRGLQLLTPINAREPNSANPLDSQNSDLFSPCLTLRIGPQGDYTIGQVADQVLSDGITWSGAYWNKMQHDAFVETHKAAIEQLAQALSGEGYLGYFGTDFVQNTGGIYEMTVDGNARMNGNDWMHFVRFPLEFQGVRIQDAYMSFLKFEADENSYARVLEKLCGKYRYSHLRFGGLTVWPSFNPDTYLGTSNIRKAALIYINPSEDRELFEEFLENVH